MPELSFPGNTRQRDYLEQALCELEGLELSRPTPTSVMAVLRTGRPGRCLAIRADIDALPIREENELDYRSCNEGVMHACGHDAHTAMLIATAVMLKNHEDELKGSNYFQRRKRTRGAEPMVKDGVIDDVDAILALHVGTMFGPFNNGDICVKPIPNTTAADDQVPDQ